MAVPMLHLQQLKNGCHSGCVLVPADGGSGHQLPRMWLADRMMGLVFLALCQQQPLLPDLQCKHEPEQLCLYCRQLWAPTTLGTII